jgi:hypothetical protein
VDFSNAHLLDVGGAQYLQVLTDMEMPQFSGAFSSSGGNRL